MSLVALAVSAVIATKLQGLLMTIPIALVLGVNLVRTGSLASIRAGCLRMAVPVLAIGIVPYAVAWFRTGNPLFPFYNAFFRSPFFAPINFVDRRWMGKGSVDLLYALTFHTSTFMEGVDGGFGFQHVLLVPSVLVAVLLIRRAEVVIPAFCGAGMFLLSVTFTQYARYLYPTFPLLALASAAVWSRAVAERWRSLLVCCLCVLIALHLYFYRSVNYFYSFYPPTPLAAQPRPQPAYPSEREFNAIVNATYGRTARVLYLGRPWAAGLDGTPLFAIEQLNSDNYAGLTAVKDVEGLKALLKRHGVTHVITSDEMTPPAKFPILGEFLPRAATLVARNADARLWRVGSPEIGLERTIDFGSIRVGEAGAQTLTVSNQGTADLTIADITLAGPGQDQYRRPGDKDSCSGTTLPPERSCTVMVRLKPTQPGTVHATLEIASNDPNQRIINVTLNGTGTP
jgi:hypothetical protein